MKKYNYELHERHEQRNITAKSKKSKKLKKKKNLTAEGAEGAERRKVNGDKEMNNKITTNRTNGTNKDLWLVVSKI